MTRCLWRPMPIVLIVYISSLSFCEGQRTQNALPLPFCIFFINRPYCTALQGGLHICQTENTRYFDGVLLPSPFPLVLSEAHRVVIYVSLFSELFWHVKFPSKILSISNLFPYPSRVLCLALKLTSSKSE